LPEGLPHRRIVEDADAQDLLLLLRARTPHLDCEQQPEATDQGSETHAVVMSDMGLPPAEA
jgi:hypothetical protein